MRWKQFEVAVPSQRALITPKYGTVPTPSASRGFPRHFAARIRWSAYTRFGLSASLFHRLFVAPTGFLAAPGEEVAVSIERDLDAGVSHLVTHERRRLAVGDQL